MEKIILFYKYISIPYPRQIQKWQEKLCQSLELKGRIIIAKEGINATLGGKEENIRSYINEIEKNELFTDIDFKESLGAQGCFPKLQIKVRKEIVTLGIDPKQLSAKEAGRHLSPKEAHELMKNGSKDLLIFDARNKYESQIGHFNNAVLADIRFFREFPQYVDSNLEQFKDKEVIMYCTGGIRCERASAYLKSKNVAKAVYQISGGIHNYVNEFPDGYFIGKNYVFDGRITVPVNNNIVGTCYVCKISCDSFTNCLNATCNRHFVCCPDCLQKLKNCCCNECFDLVEKKNVKQRPPLNKVEVYQY